MDYLYKNKIEILLIFYWIITQIIIFFYFGVKQPVDSPVYINAAKELTYAQLPDNHDFYYFGYIGFLSVVFILKGSVEIVVLIQVLISGFSGILLYHTCKTLSNSTVARIACFFYIFWFKIQVWNVYLYTESLFTSSLIISFFLLVHSKKKIHFLLTTLFIIYTISIRPTGLGLFVAFLCYFLVKIYNSRSWSKGVVIMVSSIILVFLMALTNYVLKSFNFVDSYLKAEIIYPDISLIIKKPLNIEVPAFGPYPLVNNLLFILYNPIYFFKLCLIKLLMFFGNVKPYFSIYHNLYIISFLYPIYCLAIKGIKISPKDPYVIFLLIFILIQALIVMVTSENWDGRFLIPILPYIFIFAGVGFNSLVFRSPSHSRFVDFIKHYF